MIEPPETYRKRIRTFAKLAGAILTAASIGYIAYQTASADWTSLRQIAADRIILASLATSALYCGLGIVLGMTWWVLLRGLSGHDVSARFVIDIYSVTQIYKYLPSNMLHFVGRHASMRDAGFSHFVLLAATFAEAISLCVAASLVAVILGGSKLFELAAQHVDASSGRLGVALVVVVIFVAGLFGSFVIRRQLPALSPVRLRTIFLSFIVTNVAHVLFFLGSGLILLALACGVLDVAANEYALLTAVAAIAWLLGYVVPGAVAGLGVREALIILLLADRLGSGNAIALAALYRVATLGGDVLLALLGAWARIRTTGNQGPAR